MKGIHTLRLAMAGTAAIAWCTPALAQTARDGAAAPDGTAAVSTAIGGATDDPQEQSADIVVTANKRVEKLADVPISVSVVTGDQIAKQNVIEVVDLTRSTPALNSAGPFGALSIRGVGSISFARSAEGSVGVVVDGVALANTSTNPPQLFDVARVEVLEGPQGTLFGRNSSAGVVNVTTVAPDPTKWEAIVHADVAEHNNYIGRAVLNVPVASNAALRLSGSYTQPPEQQYNRFDDSWFRTKGTSARGRFLWDPIDAITINVIGDYSRFHREGGAPWSVYLSTPGSALSRRLAACGVVVGQENREGCINGGNETRTTTYGVSNQVDARIGAYTITSISAYRAFRSTFGGTDVDSTPVNRLDINESPTSIRNFSQELRLTSPTGGLIEFVAGLYYFDSKLDGTNTQRGQILADLPLALCPIRNPLAPTLNLCPLVTLGQVQTTSSTTTSSAVFGNATINLTPSLHLLAGLRYGHEDVRAATSSVLAPGAVAGILPIAPIHGAVEDSYFSYRVGAQFDVTRDIMIYGTYTRGYKGPAVNDQTGSGNIPLIVRPEIPHAGEIGIKGTAFSGRLTASLAGFYNRVDDFQAQFFDPTASAFIFGNAPKLTTKGVSFNLIGKPTRALTLNAGMLYNDATYGDGYFVACAQGQTAAQGCQSVNGASVDDAGGNRLVGAPRWKLTGFAEYAVPISTAEAFVQADAVYTSRINFDAAYSPQNTSRAAAIVGGRIGARTRDGRYGASIFARNLFDVYRPLFRFATPAARQQLDLLSFSQISGPEARRTIGVSFDARF